MEEVASDPTLGEEEQSQEQGADGATDAGNAEGTESEDTTPSEEGELDTESEEIPGEPGAPTTGGETEPTEEPPTTPTTPTKPTTTAPEPTEAQKKIAERKAEPMSSTIYWRLDEDGTLYLSEKFDLSMEAWDLSGDDKWDSSKVTSVKIVDEYIMPASTAEWFSGAKNLVELDLSHVIIVRGVTNMTDMFKDCSGLLSLKLNSEFAFNNGCQEGLSGLWKRIRTEDGKVPESSDKYSVSAKGAGVAAKNFAATELVGKLGGTWSRADKTFTITFSPNGGTGTKESISGLLYGQIASIGANAFTREGYDFAGWNTKADGTGTSFAEGSIISVGSDVTLYAMWDKQGTELTITFKPNGPEAEDVTQTGVRNTNIKLRANTFTWPGHKFLGWSTSSSATKAEYADGATLKVDDNALTLYAVWETAVNVSAKGTPTVSSHNLAEVADAILTSDEKEAGAEMWLESKLLDSAALAAIPDQVKVLSTSATSRGASAGLYFDLSLFKQVGDGEAEKIESKLPVAVKFTLDVPAQMRNSLSTVTRTFYLLRYHDGEATLISSGTGTTLNVISDQFSTYLLAYKDETRSPYATGTNTSTTSTNTTRSTTTTTPNTGDASIAGAGASAFAGSVAALFGALRRRKN